MNKRADIVFNDYELGAINIVVLKEIEICRKTLRENDFVYRDDKIATESYLKTLIDIDNKINKREVK